MAEGSVDADPSETTAVGAVPLYPDIPTYRYSFGRMNIWEGDGWKRESMAWKEGVYIAANLTGPLQFTVRGPHAQELLSRLSINDVYNWPVGRSKHLVMPDKNGLIANHGLAIRDDELTFRQLASIPWAVFQAPKLGLDVDITFQDIFILQIAGPRSVQLIERLLNRDIRDVAFLDKRSITIPGLDVDVEVDLELSRIGMAGTLAYEIRGPFDAGPAVFDAAYRAGSDFGVTRLGWRTYAVNHTEGGFPQQTVSFSSSMLADEDADRIFPVEMTGSADPSDLRARLRTPQEVNWGWMAKFDHDFIGRAAVEAEARNPKRRTVILRWNRDDILDVFASQFEDGEEYRIFEFPSSPQQPAGGHADLVTDAAGATVGISSAAIYSYYYREMLSQCVIDLDHAEVGTEVVVHWGDYGRRIKQIRATVDRFPYLDLPSNRDYDFTSVPSGISGADA